MDCKHREVACLNHYDTFRKYRCARCGGIFLCDCEKALALRFLPHQVRFASEFGTREKHHVTGFAPKMCAECRGKKEIEHPRAAIFGQKGKVERYYWREIFKTYCEKVLIWQQQQDQNFESILEFEAEFLEIAKLLKKDSKKEWQKLHETKPKYNLSETTEAKFLSKIKVPVSQIEAKYFKVEKDGRTIGKWQIEDGEFLTGEAIAAQDYAANGFDVFYCESKCINVWVATFLGYQIQDSFDDRVKTVFRSPTLGWTPHQKGSSLISIRLPEDFGSPNYFRRRGKQLEVGISRLAAARNPIALFDSMLEDTKSLRDYLWVNNDDAVRVSRTALKILPKEIVVKSLEWAIQDFWNRQHGWPDLLVSKGKNYSFVEVKTPKDQLSLEQMNWFQWAVQEAKISCGICRIKNA